MNKRINRPNSIRTRQMDTLFVRDDSEQKRNVIWMTQSFREVISF